MIQEIFKMHTTGRQALWMTCDVDDKSKKRTSLQESSWAFSQPWVFWALQVP
jgi:hypothetical protein